MTLDIYKYSNNSKNWGISLAVYSFTASLYSFYWIHFRYFTVILVSSCIFVLFLIKYRFDLSLFSIQGCNSAGHWSYAFFPSQQKLLSLLAMNRMNLLQVAVPELALPSAGCHFYPVKCLVVMLTQLMTLCSHTCWIFNTPTISS